MELILVVTVSDDKYEVHRELRPVDWVARDAVLKLDYNYTPWPRKEGNLLW